MVADTNYPANYPANYPERSLATGKLVAAFRTPEVVSIEGVYVTVNVPVAWPPEVGTGSGGDGGREGTDPWEHCIRAT
jgi:hypothetical protein